MTSKERAKLKSIASTMETIFQVGKNPISPELIKTVDEALTAREMIKIKVLETSEVTAKEAAEIISEQVSCEVVQVIGSKIVLFRQFKKDKNSKKKSYLDND